MIKVLFLAHEIGQGGSDRILLNVAEGFISMCQAQVHIICAKKLALMPVSKNIQIHFTTLPTWLDKQKMLSDHAMRHKVISLEKKYGDFDLILSNYGHRKLLFPKYIRNKLYYWIHIDPTIPFKNVPENQPNKQKRFIKKHQQYFNKKNLITVSKGTKKGILNITKVKPKSICTIYNPFDFDKIKTLSFQANPNIPRKDYIIHAARFEVKCKRQDLLFAAFKKIKTNCKLVLLTEKSNALVELIREFNIQDKVIIAGFQNNPYPWFKEAKVTILCSDFESFGNVLIESLICGTPVISTNCISGPSEILTGNMANWLVPPGDVKALAQKIDQLLAKPEPIDLNIIKKFEILNILGDFIRLTINMPLPSKTNNNC